MVWCVLASACLGELDQDYDVLPNTMEVDDQGTTDMGLDLDLSSPAQDSDTTGLDAAMDLVVAQEDLASAQDAAKDLSTPPDLVMLPDLSSPPDMAPPIIDMGPPDPPDMPPANPDGFYLDQVTWLDPNIAGWNESATLASVTFERGRDICLNYSIPGGGTWPVVQAFETDVVANAWIFIENNGVWYGATWEWMRPGQTCKALTSVGASHIKKRPFDEASGWEPSTGDVFYFMVSGLARNGLYSNVSERTNPVRVVWP